jgi:hypothetical protein
MREDNPHGIVGLKGTSKEIKEFHRQIYDLRFLACEWQQSVFVKVSSRSHISLSCDLLFVVHQCQL